MATNHLYDFVIDCSVTMAWCFEDESTDYTDSILKKLKELTAIVPTIWPLEVANFLLSARRKKRISEITSASFIDKLSELPIVVDHSTTKRALHTTSMLAAQEHLTIYDAAYLELAMKEKVPLITLDKELIKVAKKLHVPTII